MPYITVVVLGPVAQSPRMCYHALSLAECGVDVDLVGLSGGQPHALVAREPRIKLHLLKPLAPLPATRRVLFPLYALWKLLYYTLGLLWILLFRVGAPTHMLMQTPQALPTLCVVRVACWLRRAHMVIDWHNFAFSIMALGLRGGQRNWMVRVARQQEIFWGSLGDTHLTVTNAMRQELIGPRWRFPAERVHTLHDRPAPMYCIIGERERREFLQRWLPTVLPGRENIVASVIARRANLIVSSTSWTPDEDFSVLYDALLTLDKPGAGDVPLLCVVTGKGPMREAFERRISAHAWRRCVIVTAFLTAEDYPLILASADIGVSLHQSSSGLDLPMKVLDMFGCGLPVAARNFSCLDELVDASNGVTFDDAAELALRLAALLAPESADRVAAMRQDIASQVALNRWTDEWGRVAPHIFDVYQVLS